MAAGSKARYVIEACDPDDTVVFFVAPINPQQDYPGRLKRIRLLQPQELGFQCIQPSSVGLWR